MALERSAGTKYGKEPGIPLEEKERKLQLRFARYDRAAGEVADMAGGPFVVVSCGCAS